MIMGDKDEMNQDYIFKCGIPLSQEKLKLDPDDCQGFSVYYDKL